MLRHMAGATFPPSARLFGFDGLRGHRISASGTINKMDMIIPEDGGHDAGHHRLGLRVKAKADDPARFRLFK